MRDLSCRVICCFQGTGLWDLHRDISTSYAIQGLGSVFVESIEGSFSGVVGLPLFETADLLAKQGIDLFK